MSRSNGNRRVNKADGTKKLAKRAMTKSHRHDSPKLIQDQLQAAEDKGFEMACQWLEIKLLDGGEYKSPNEIRAEAAQRARELRLDIKKIQAEIAKGTK